MALVRWVTEMGMGVDVHGHDYTKAARRAVSDALRHSSLNFFAATDKTVHDMHVEVIVAVADPDAVDLDAVQAEVPYGTVTVRAVVGGLDVPEIVKPDGSSDGVVMANAAILVSFPDD
ncbi:MAG: Lin0512 family protein [Ilumatobacter sp.]|uniref:Lin0512 family protein n=1 Tax=Ilumatobacter sp. TaxID=1967498 RepID=UPI003C7081FF